MDIDKSELKRQIQNVKAGGNIQGDSFEAKIVRHAMGAVANQRGRRKIRGESQRVSMLKDTMKGRDSSELLSMVNELGGRKNKKAKRQIAQAILESEEKQQQVPKLAPVQPISLHFDDDNDEKEELATATTATAAQTKKNRNKKKKEKQKKKAKEKQAMSIV